MLYSDWDIRNEGRKWRSEEVRERWQRTIGKIELIEGEISWSDEERLTMLGLLLELLGADRAVQLGDPEVWRRAVGKLNA
ncbi:MAG TPA: hypothetical protein VE078_12855 [Thermoanaerobaculia bacterium]|nr:hypothetical protein [Thermoanaerobaculia bacterium]